MELLLDRWGGILGLCFRKRYVIYAFPVWFTYAIYALSPIICGVPKRNHYVRLYDFEYVSAFWFWCYCCMISVNSVYIYVMRWLCSMDMKFVYLSDWLLSYFRLCVAFRFPSGAFRNMALNSLVNIWIYIYGLRAFRIYEYIGPNGRVNVVAIVPARGLISLCEYIGPNEPLWISHPDMVFVTPQALSGNNGLWFVTPLPS